MDPVPLEPAGSGMFFDFPTHSFVERKNGFGLVPNDGPLYFALFFYALVPAAWYVTRGLDIDAGLKLVAWLFPLLTATGPLILWVIMSKFCASFFFNIYRNELILKGFRFKGTRTIPFGAILGIQTCYGGAMRTKKAYYEKFELNAVIRQDGKIARIHLVGHSDRKTIERQAMKIIKRFPVQRFDQIDESMRRWSDK